jgi:4-amino-4-deoxy-L-arabinose transferase-like glycosyltransferase
MSANWIRRVLPLMAIVGAMVALRLALLAADAVPFNGDEAIVALMARHILAGERPAFFYGQAYLGSTDAWLVAAAFTLFGETVLSIRIAQVALYSATLVTTYLVARRFGLSKLASCLAALLMGLPPVMLTLYTTATLGGYGETLLLGNLLILIAYAIESAEANRARYLRWGLFGLCAGFAFWTFGLILIYLVPVSLWLLYRGRWSAWRGYLIAFAGFAIGSLPWWASIGQFGGALLGELAGSAIANTVAAPTVLDSLGVRLVNFFVFGATAWLGLRYPWSPDLVMPIIGLAVVAVYVAAFVHAVRRGPRLLWGMIGALLLTYLLTPFGGDPSGRYFVPLYFPLSIFAAMWLDHLRERASARWSRWLANLLIVIVVGYDLAGTALAVQQPHGITTQFDRVTWIERGREQALIDFLLAHGETRGYTNYWVAYPIAFLSNEGIISAPRLPYHLDFSYTRRDDRHRPYGQAVAESPRAFYITTNHPQLDAQIRDGLDALGVAFEEETIGSYHIFYNMSRKVEPEELGW